MPSELALDVSGRTVRFGATVAVDGLDLAIPRGETVALLGPNGAGKSTTINAVLGLLHPAAGREVLSLVRRGYPHAWPPDDLVATAGIGGLLDRPVEALSGGQRLRALLALALAGAPPLLLLDEPTSAMDVEGRRHFWRTMRELAGRGHTVVFATHHLEEADAVADRVVVVAGGRVVADGAAAQLKAGAARRTVFFARTRVEAARVAEEKGWL